MRFSLGALSGVVVCLALACGDADSDDAGGGAGGAGAAGAGGAGGGVGGAGLAGAGGAGGAGLAGAGGAAAGAGPGGAGAAGAVACAATRSPVGPPALYLAFDGVTLTGVADGADDATANASSFVTETTTFPPFRAGAPDRAAQIAQIAADVALVLAPYAIRVTTERPAEGHLMIVFAGQASGSGLLGFVRHDCGDTVRHDVVVFFENVADPSRGRFAAPNEAVFAVARSLGLAKSNGPGHPCSCDPSGTCANDALCRITPDAVVSFGTCADSPAVQDEALTFANAFGCR